MMIFGVRKQKDYMWLAYLIIIIVILIVIAFVADALSSYEESYARTHVDTVKEAVYDTLITCYALEGRYPDTLEHLADNYGLILDRSRYIYHYLIFASNIMPDFDVIPINIRKGEEPAFIYGENDND